MTKVDLGQSAIDLLACPVCGDSMQENDKQIICLGGHSFDKAKENYVNLLLANKKNSKSPGDSKESVIARHQFLNDQHYAPVAGLIDRQIKTFANKGMITLVDSGCGEGYYLEQLQQKNELLLPLGFDISKPALRTAARQGKNCHWFVASAKALPMKSNSIDVLLNCFSPFFEESLKLIKPGGLMIFVNGEEKHLLEMRQAIYRENKVHHFKAKDFGDLAPLINQERLQYTIKLESKNSLSNLVNMTPHHFKTSKKVQEKFINSGPKEISVDVVTYIYQRPY